MIGILGGMSWESSKMYYHLLNQKVRDQKGSMHSANLILRSLDFEYVASLQHQNRWTEITTLLVNEAIKLESIGATCIAFATNTMHKVADEVESALTIPLVHIVDAVGWNLTKNGFKKVTLLGTDFTMTESFYRERLEKKFGVQVFVPSKLDRKLVHRIIYDELVKGIFQESSKQVLKRLARQQKNENEIDAIILGCTELPLLLRKNDTQIPLIDTTAIHVEALLQYA